MFGQQVNTSIIQYCTEGGSGRGDLGGQGWPVSRISKGIFQDFQEYPLLHDIPSNIQSKIYKRSNKNASVAV